MAHLFSKIRTSRKKPNSSHFLRTIISLPLVLRTHRNRSRKKSKGPERFLLRSHRGELKEMMRRAFPALCFNLTMKSLKGQFEGDFVDKMTKRSHIKRGNGELMKRKKERKKVKVKRVWERLRFTCYKWRVGTICFKNSFCALPQWIKVLYI